MFRPSARDFRLAQLGEMFFHFVFFEGKTATNDPPEGMMIIRSGAAQPLPCRLLDVISGWGETMISSGGL